MSYLGFGGWLGIARRIVPRLSRPFQKKAATHAHYYHCKGFGEGPRVITVKLVGEVDVNAREGEPADNGERSDSAAKVEGRAVEAGEAIFNEFEHRTPPQAPRPLLRQAEALTDILSDRFGLHLLESPNRPREQETAEEHTDKSSLPADSLLRRVI